MRSSLVTDFYSKSSDVEPKLVSREVKALSSVPGRFLELQRPNPPPISSDRVNDLPSDYNVHFSPYPVGEHFCSFDLMNDCLDWSIHY